MEHHKTFARLLVTDLLSEVLVDAFVYNEEEVLSRRLNQV